MTTPFKWSGFAKKSPAERLELLENYQLISKAMHRQLKQAESLSLSKAEQLVENTISTFSLPFALVPDFLIDKKSYHLPLVTEEPSVVAAASYAAKIIKRSGGFTAKVLNREMIGQVALYDVVDTAQAKKAILEQEKKLIITANRAYPSILKRGGGARRLWLEEKDTFLIVYLTVDCQEAMGANLINTMLEAITPLLVTLSQGQALMGILSNYATESLVTVSCQIDSRLLSLDKTTAEKIAQKISLASHLAQVDPYRASTHNKGIFNGIDGLLLATGNDWRAIEAGGHAYSCREGSYRGLSQWHYDATSKCLRGSLTMPMPLATKGGSIGINPSVKIAHHILGHPDAKTLAKIALSLGLAQNLAALKALVSTGIQSGHMKHQARSLALLAGAKETEVAELVKRLLTVKPLNLENAKKQLQELKKTAD